MLGKAHSTHNRCIEDPPYLRDPQARKMALHHPPPPLCTVSRPDFRCSPRPNHGERDSAPPFGPSTLNDEALHGMLACLTSRPHYNDGSVFSSHPGSSQAHGKCLRRHMTPHHCGCMPQMGTRRPAITQLGVGDAAWLPMPRPSLMACLVGWVL